MLIGRGYNISSIFYIRNYTFINPLTGVPDDFQGELSPWTSFLTVSHNKVVQIGSENFGYGYEMFLGFQMTPIKKADDSWPVFDLTFWGGGIIFSVIGLIVLIRKQK